MDIMKATPVKIIALIAALLAAVWVGVMIADGPTTKTAEVSQEQVDEFQNGQWGETSPMESSNGFKANGYGSPQWQDVSAQTEAALKDMSGSWLFDLTEEDRAQVCVEYREDSYGFALDLHRSIREVHGETHLSELENWMISRCGDYR